MFYLVLKLRMRSVGLLLIIVSKERPLSLLHGVIFSLSESPAYIMVIPGHYLWGIQNVSIRKIYI